MSAPGGSNGDSGGASRTVMIVEDEFIIALALRRQIENLGCTVCCVTDSSEKSLAGAEEHRPDVVLMDVSIRGALDGIETARRITGGMGIPVIVVSAFSDAQTIQRATDAGASAVLGKPASDEDLRQTLSSVLGGLPCER